MKKIDLKNIKAWIIKKNKNSNDTIVVLMPEYYADFYKNEKQLNQWLVGKNEDYLVIGFKRKFKFNELIKEMKEMTQKIMYKYKKIYLIGHSKGGVVLNYLLNEYETNNKIKDAITISVPYKGTPFASIKQMEKILKNKEVLGIKYGKILFDFYKKIFDGDFSDQMIEEDSFILRNLKVNELIQNYVFKVSLIEFIKDTMKLNFESSALFVIDKIIKLNGDGIVSMKSQYLSDISIKQNIIYGTHKSGYKKVMKIVLK